VFQIDVLAGSGACLPYVDVTIAVLICVVLEGLDGQAEFPF